MRSPTPKAKTKQREASRKDEIAQDDEEDEASAEITTPSLPHANTEYEEAEEEATTHMDGEDENDGAEDFGDDFDDFEEGGGAEDGFDDFDNEFAQPEPVAVQPQTPVTPQHRPPPFVSKVRRSRDAANISRPSPISTASDPTKSSKLQKIY